MALCTRAPSSLKLFIPRTKGCQHVTISRTKACYLGPYYTLAYPGDRLVLKANETAIIDGTVGYDWAYAFVSILYKRGTNDLTNMILPLGLTGGTMPLYWFSVKRRMG